MKATGKIKRIFVEDVQALSLLEYSYLQQHQSIIFSYGIKYLSSFLNSIFKHDEEVDIHALRQAGLPEGLIKIAIDLRDQGYEGISGFDNLHKYFADMSCAPDPLHVICSDAFIEAAVTSQDMDGEAGHIRTSKLWQTIFQYQWQGCDIALFFKDIDYTAPSQSIDVLDVHKHMEKTAFDVMLTGIGRCFLNWELDYNSPIDQKRFCQRLEALEAQTGLKFHIQDISPVTHLTIYDEGAVGLNPVYTEVLRSFGYSKDDIQSIARYVVGTRQIPLGLTERLKAKGFQQHTIDTISEALVNAQDIRFAVTKWILGDTFCRDVLGVSQNQLEDPDLDILEYLGFSQDEIDAFNQECFGCQSFSGCEVISDTHQQVLMQLVLFPKEEIAFQAMLNKSISGQVYCRMSLPHEISVKQMEGLAFQAWSSGLDIFHPVRENSTWDAPVLFSQDETVSSSAALKVKDVA